MKGLARIWFTLGLKFGATCSSSCPISNTFHGTSSSVYEMREATRPWNQKENAETCVCTHQALAATAAAAAARLQTRSPWSHASTNLLHHLLGRGQSRSPQ